MTSGLVANVHSPLKPGAPPPAAVSGHHVAAEAVAPVAMMAMAVMAATHATALAPTTTLAPASSGSFGGDERGGADSGDGGDSENRLADHASLLVVIGCVLTSPDPSCERSVGFTARVSNRPFRDSHHIRRSHCRTILGRPVRALRSRPVSPLAPKKAAAPT